MAHDVAQAIVKEAANMVEDEKKRQHDIKFKELQRNKIALEINYVYMSEDGEAIDEDYMFLRFTKYNDELYWVVKDHEEDFRVVSLTKNEHVLDILAKSYRTLDVMEQQEYEKRASFVLNLRIPEKHISNDGKEYTCYGGCVETITYDKNTEIADILQDGLTILKGLEKL